jgi:membrane protein DedA with SNARE-associated domain
MSATIFTWIVTAIATAGYAGIVGLMAIESACIPLPSEIIMPFSGYLVSTGRFGLLAVATAGALGCNLGSTLAYLVGAYGGRPAVLRWGRYVLFTPSELERLDRFFARFGSWAVLIGRLLPAVRTFISLPAGIARMPRMRFQIYTFLGSWPWCFVLAYVGYALGRQWNSNPALQTFFRRFDAVVVAALVALFALYVYTSWRSSRRGR